MVRQYKQQAYQESLKKAHEGLIHPVLTCIRLTRACNIRCYYCSELYVPTGRDLNFEDWKHVTDVAYDLGNRDIVLSGGEPFLKDFLVDLVRYTASRDALVSIATNGRLLTREKLASLSEAGLDYLCISIDSFKQECPENWGKVLTSRLNGILKEIGKSEYNFETQISTVVTRNNLEDLSEMVRYFSSLGISTKFMLMMRNKINKKATENLAIQDNDAQIRKTIDSLLELKEQGALLIDDDFTLERVNSFFNGTRSHNCKGGEFDLSINNDGRLVICPDGIVSERSVFELKSIENYQRFIEECKTVTDQCGGCLWSHKQRLEESIIRGEHK
ncbi:MAG: radical SAM protein [Candidatus Daviesbacteria bacterium]|nr:radical SAM protein [Candidatus Daviesbacteria bacterium]